MNKNHKVLLEALMLMIWITTLALFLSQIWTSGPKCMSNPLIYGVKALSVKNNDTFTCLCRFDSQPTYSIYVDSKHWELRQGDKLLPDYDFGGYDINWTDS